jgi:diguanylate cyclase (GGDEF)-like protein
MPQQTTKYLRHKLNIIYLVALIVISVLLALSYTNGLESKVEKSINLLLEKQSVFDEQIDILQRRHTLMRDIISVDDPFLKDEFIIEHHLLASRFMALRLKLKNLPLSQEEQDLLDLQINNTTKGYSAQIDLIQKSIDETRPEHYDELLDHVIPLTENAYNNIREYKNVMEEKTREAITAARLNYESGWRTIIWVYLILICSITAIFIWINRNQRKHHQELEWKATHDNLTQLCDRGEFERVLKQTIDYRERDATNSILYIDLDEFKVINDSCGHMAGDELLKNISSTIKNSVREHDVVARLGGDEFGVLLMGCNKNQAKKVADLVCERVREYSFEWEGNIFQVGTSIGVMEIDNKMTCINDIMKRVDTVCYTAKASGKNRAHVFSYDDEHTLQRIDEIEQADQIRAALRENRFMLYRQRFKSMKENLPESCEILVRMIDNDGRVLLPGRFIPAATRFKLMKEIDKWVVLNVLDYLSANPGDETIYNINLSGQTLNSDECHQFIIDSIEKYDVDGSKICFEITEDSAITNLNKTIKFMSTLHDMGCHFALDDFGTGLSSFTYLQKLPVDTIKIDGSFVKNLNPGSYEHSFVKAMCSISKNIDIHIVAEWVDSQYILDQLTDLEVDYVQGNLIEAANPLVDTSSKIKLAG